MNAQQQRAPREPRREYDAHRALTDAALRAAAERAEILRRLGA